MPARRLKEYLDRENVKYEAVEHSRAYTSQETAESAHIPGKEFAKSVIVNTDSGLAMVVVPASTQVDLERLKKALRSQHVALAQEREFKEKFPDCEIGAMPPFGNLYGMDVFVSQTLRQDQEITFNAGSHTEAMRLAYRDFERLVQPTPISL